MQVCACLVLLLDLAAVLPLELFPHQHQELVGTVEVKLMSEGGETGGGGARERRSAPTLPGQLAFQFSVSGERVVLNLEQNTDLNSVPPVFVVREGQAVRDGGQDDMENMAFYQDVTKGAAIMVKKDWRQRANYELMGTYIVEEEQFTIQPIRAQQGSGSRNTVSNHSITRMMTHISLRNDILDFVEGPVLEETVSGSKRQKREATLNTVELLIVTDFAIYNTWYEMTKGSSPVERRRQALDNMKQYYAFVLNGIDLRYASIKEPDFRIDVTFAGIVMMDDPKESMWTESLAGANNNTGFVESSDALESFRSWILTNGSSFPPHDHVMLFTGFNLTYGGSTANAGLAYIKSMCNPEFSISIVEEYFEFRIIAIAAHELGHSLGARHDMDGNKCFAFFLYIMTSRFRFPTRSKATNPWRFSKCSIDYFRKYIETLNSNGTNCLLTNEATRTGNEIAGFLGDQPGQVYEADGQCQLKYQDERSHVCREMHVKGYEGTCSGGLMCRIPAGGGTCGKIVPADGTLCGQGKWCMGGRCIPTDEPMVWSDSCPWGEAPELAGGGGCRELVAGDPRACYNVTLRLQCCKSCEALYTGIAECEYGDHGTDCQPDLCPTYPFHTQNTSCCATCHNFFNPTTPTTPPPSTTPTTTITTPISADVVATPGPTSVSYPEVAETATNSYVLLEEASTKSEKLMKSELMPTSGSSAWVTTPSTERVSGGETGNNVISPSTGTSTPPVTSTLPPLLATTMGFTRNPYGKGLPAPRRYPGPRVWNFAQLQRMRQQRLRQRQAAARRQYLFYYNRLLNRRTVNRNTHQPTQNNQRGYPGSRWSHHHGNRPMGRTGHLGSPWHWTLRRRNQFPGGSLSWEQSMEELERELDEEDRRWGLGKRRRRSLRHNVETDDNVGAVRNPDENEKQENGFSPTMSSDSHFNTVTMVTNALSTKVKFDESDNLTSNIPDASSPKNDIIMLNIVSRSNMIDHSTTTSTSNTESPEDSVFLENQNSMGRENTYQISETPYSSIDGLNDRDLTTRATTDLQQTSPQFLLHRPKHMDKNHLRLKYEVIDFNPQTSGQQSWIFHAMIDPAMIPAATKWIKLHQKHQKRMMPYGGETFRGPSKGSRSQLDSGREAYLNNRGREHYKFKGPNTAPRGVRQRDQNLVNNVVDDEKTNNVVDDEKNLHGDGNSIPPLSVNEETTGSIIQAGQNQRLTPKTGTNRVVGVPSQGNNFNEDWELSVFKDRRFKDGNSMNEVPEAHERGHSRGDVLYRVGGERGGAGLSEERESHEDSEEEGDSNVAESDGPNAHVSMWSKVDGLSKQTISTRKGDKSFESFKSIGERTNNDVIDSKVSTIPFDVEDNQREMTLSKPKML